MDRKSSIASDTGKKKETPSSSVLSPSGHRKARASFGRVYQACERCRKMKMKCDGVQPTCTRCKSANYDCIWHAKGKPGPKPKARIPLWGAAREEALRSMGVSTSEWYVTRSASMSDLETGSTTASSTQEEGYPSLSRRIRVADTITADAAVEDEDSDALDPTMLALLSSSEDGMTSTELRRLAHFMDFIGLSRLPAPTTQSIALPTTPTNKRRNATLIQDSHSANMSVSSRRIVPLKDLTRSNTKIPQLNMASKTSKSRHESNSNSLPVSCPPLAHRPSSSGSSTASDMLTYPNANVQQPRLGDSMCYVRNSLVPADQKLVARASRHDHSHT